MKKLCLLSLVLAAIPVSALAASPFTESSDLIRRILADPKVVSEVEGQGSGIDGLMAVEGGYRVYFKGIGFPNPMKCWLDVVLVRDENTLPALRVNEAECEK
jgi:hypothetical protein